MYLQEEKQRKLLRVRLEMAKFLQETLRESGLKANAHIVGSDAFKEFFRKVCNYLHTQWIFGNSGLLVGPFYWRVPFSNGHY
jgi:hypothetical protein